MDMKKASEVVLMGSMLALSLAAQAGSVAASSGSQTHTVPVGTYVLESFVLNLSANVAMTYTDTDPTDAAVGAANTKGMHTFGGTSRGGSVKQCETTSVAAPTPIAAPLVTTGC